MERFRSEEGEGTRRGRRLRRREKIPTREIQTDSPSINKMGSKKRKREREREEKKKKSKKKRENAAGVDGWAREEGGRGTRFRA